MSTTLPPYPTNAPIIGTANTPSLVRSPASGAAAPAQAATRPDYVRPEYTDAESTLKLCRDMMEGTAAIQKAGPAYLPKYPRETSASYNTRRTIAEVFRAFERTVQAAVGMITATPPALVDSGAGAADKAIVADCEDIDLQGTHFEVFAKQVLEDGILSGLMAILVDSPPRPDGIALNGDDEAKLNLRPYWNRIPRERILSWIIEAPDWTSIITRYKAGEISADQATRFARQVITRQIVIYEPTDVPSGEFGIMSADRYRVIRLTDAGVQFRVLEKRRNNAGEHFALVDSGVMVGAKNAPLSSIPLAVGYAGRKLAPFVADIPLLALAELNLGHYRVSANRRYLMELCHVPTLAIIGMDPDDGVDDEGQPKRREIVIGPQAVLFVPMGGDAKYVAAAPDALQSSLEEKEDLVSQMAALGMSFLAKDKRGQTETALGRRLDDAAENATHATAARALQDVLEQALAFHAEYRGVPAPSVSVPTSYASDQVDPQLAGVLWQAVAADRLPMEAFLEYIQTGKLPDDIDLDGLTEIRLAKQQIEAQRKRDALVANLGDPGAGPGNDPSAKQPPSPDPAPSA